MKSLTVYGTSNCQPCKQLRSVLDERGIKYTYKELGADYIGDIMSVPCSVIKNDDIEIARIFGNRIDAVLDAIMEA